VRDLKVCFSGAPQTATVVDGVSFDIQRGETFAILGESGCGKSMTSLAIMGLLPESGERVAGQVALDGEELTQLSPNELRKRRGSRIAMIFQEPMTSLNPVLTVGQQIGESLVLHKGLKGKAAHIRMLELLEAVGIPAPEQRLVEYPHQLSGGMKQRVMIAIALAGEPDLLIADEPTTALDVTTQAQVLQLLKGLQRQTGMAILLITHDLGVVAEVADHVAVMYAGQLVEQAERDVFFTAPQHPYSLKLFSSLPSMQKRDQALAVIKGSVPPLTQQFVGCRFENRCEYAWQLCRDRVPSWSASAPGHHLRCHRADAELLSDWPETAVAETSLVEASLQFTGESEALLAVKGLKVHFPVRRGMFARRQEYLYAVDGIDLTINQGKTLALVGESGCGKTTAGKAILQLIQATAGEVVFGGVNLAQLSGEALRHQRQSLQFIFQDPFSAMNPRMRIGDIIAEGLVAQGIGDTQHRRVTVDTLLEHVGLSATMRNRYPHEFSGGQRQRICIARALALNPKLIVCDEPTSALDVSVQAQVLNLLQKLQSEMGLSYLFITHNISVVAYLAHEVAVMYLGRIVERGAVADVLEQPKHPYTQALLAAVPEVNPKTHETALRLAGDMPSPIDPPTGCYFHPRCPKAMPECRQVYPEAVSVSATHSVACVLYSK